MSLAAGRPSRGMTRRQRRLTLIGLAGLVLAIAAGPVLYALSDRIVFFNGPSDIVANPPAPGARIRLGGLVETGSIAKAADGHVDFAVTDGKAAVKVAYRGILPDLFREGQGVVTEGTMNGDGTFSADTVLAKHDENYMPKEVVEALKRSGKWKEGEGAPEHTVP
jgi:cytochrome c-type biogenesis protein CcmE